jgi:hypothetical protein
MITHPIMIGIGAGLASAVLFAVMATGSPFGLLLSYVSPLPIFIAALGWLPLTGLLALAVAGAIISATISSKAGIAYALGIGGPAFLLSYLALKQHNKLASLPNMTNADGLPRVGTILIWLPAVAAVVTVLGALSLSRDHAQYAGQLTAALEAMLRQHLSGPNGTSPVLPSGTSVEELARLVVSILPFATGASFTALFAANMWAGARAVAMSGRLPRSWEPLPDLLMPITSLGLFGIAMIMSALGGFVGVYGQALAGGVTAALSMQGLAAIHRVTRGKTARPALLGLTYAMLMLGQIWAVPLLAFYGLYRIISAAKTTGGTKPPFQIS